jgi:hypothetical protein
MPIWSRRSVEDIVCASTARALDGITSVLSMRTYLSWTEDSGSGCELQSRGRQAVSVTPTCGPSYGQTEALSPRPPQIAAEHTARQETAKDVSVRCSHSNPANTPRFVPLASGSLSLSHACRRRQRGRGRRGRGRRGRGGRRAENCHAPSLPLTDRPAGSPTLTLASTHARCLLCRISVQTAKRRRNALHETRCVTYPVQYAPKRTVFTPDGRRFGFDCRPSPLESSHTPLQAKK